MKSRIGYLMSQFPGQTHTWLWREIQALKEIEIEPDLVSTQLPPPGIISHPWAAQAQEQTTYLVPFGIKDFAGAVIEILKAGPMAWWHCLSIIINAKDTSLAQKFWLLGMILMAGKLLWLAKSRNWSHVHVLSCADAANIAMFAGILGDLTYSMTLLGSLHDFGPNQEQKWKHAAFALTVSEKLRNEVKDQLADYVPKQIVVASMGVNLAETKRQTAYIPWKTGSLCKIYTCGRLNPVKGHKYLIETVELLRKRGFDVRLQIAGEDIQGGTGYRLDLEKIIRDKSISEYVELLGAVSEARNRQGMEEAHIFALASLNEGISVAVMEAMAMEMPVVVTDVGGNHELIDNGVDAIMVQSEKPEEMADAIVKVLLDQELALSLSQKSRQKVATKFHHRVSAEALAQCLTELAVELVEKSEEITKTAII